MESKLEQNESLCLESCCRLQLMKHQNVPKRKFSVFKLSFAKLQQVIIHSLHNLKASIKYYALTLYVSGQAGHRFYTKNTSSQTNFGC